MKKEKNDIGILVDIGSIFCMHIEIGYVEIKHPSKFI